MEAKYRILFSGKLMPGQELSDVVPRVAAKFKMQDDTARELVLNGAGRVLKRNLSAAAAEKYRAALTAVGLVITIEPQPEDAGDEPESFLRSYPITQTAPPSLAKGAAADSRQSRRRAERGDGSGSPCPKCGANEVSDLTGVCQACGIVVERYLANQGIGSGAGAAHNPYAPPQSDVSPPILEVEDDELREPRGVPAGRGLGWIGEAWPLFREQPLAWIGAVLLFYLVMFGLNLVPVIGGIASSVLGPIFTAGLVMGAHSQFRGEGFTVSHLFAGFSTRPGPLLVVGLMYLVFAFAVGSVMVLSMGALFATSSLGLESGPVDAAAIQAMASGPAVVLPVLLVLLLSIPFAMAMFFAPALVGLNAVPVMQAFKLSFMGCLKNILSFLVFGLVAVVMVVVGMLPFGLGLLLVLPVLTISLYTAFRDIYYHC